MAANKVTTAKPPSWSSGEFEPNDGAAGRRSGSNVKNNVTQRSQQPQLNEPAAFVVHERPANLK